MILQGKTLISTVSSAKSGEIKKIFIPLGANVIDFPMIEITPVKLSPQIKQIMERINDFHWIIFTSSSGVQCFYHLLKQAGPEPRIPAHIKLATIGVATARELEQTDRKADFISSGNTSENLAQELMDKADIMGKNVLLPLGNLASPELPKRLDSVAKVTRIDVYNTIKPNTSDDDVLNKIKSNKYDLVLFTSSSGVENFIDVLGPYDNKSAIRAASIGTVTTGAIKQHGLSCILTAKNATYIGLAEEIVKYYS